MLSHAAAYYESQPRGFLKAVAAAEIPEVAGKRIAILGYSVTAGKSPTLSDGTTTVALNGSYEGGGRAPAYEFKVGGKVTVGGEGEGHLTYCYA